MMTEMLPGIHFEQPIVQPALQSLSGYQREQRPLLQLGKSCGSPHVGQEPLQPPAQSLGSNRAKATLPLCTVWADTSRSLTPDSIHDLCLCCFPVAQRGAQSLGSSPVTVSRVPRLSCLLKHGWSVWQLRNLGRGHHIRLGCDVPHPTVPFGFT